MRIPAGYVLVTPVHDECELLEELAAVVRAQELRPLKWILVDDDSKDGTAERLAQLARRDRWIEPTVLPRGVESGPARYAEVLAHGFRTAAWLLEAEGLQVEYVANLDADVRPPPQLFAELVARCEGDRSIGIASCRLGAVDDDGSFAPQLEQPCGAPRSGLRLWRRECLEQAAFYPTPHWGSVTSLRARNRGWRTVVFDDLQAELVRPDADRRGWWYGYRRIGEGAWYVGAHPLSIAMSALSVTAHARGPEGVALLAGYALAALQRRRRSNDPELLEFYGHALPRRQVSGLVARLSRWTSRR